MHNVFLSVAIALLKATDVKKTLKHFNDQFFFCNTNSVDNKSHIKVLALQLFSNRSYIYDTANPATQHVWWYHFPNNKNSIVSLTVMEGYDLAMMWLLWLFKTYI